MPSWKTVVADALGLEQTDDRFHQGVVVGVADRPDRGCDPSSARCSVNRMEVYCDCRRRSDGSAGRARRGVPSRSRSHSAIRSGVRTRSVTLVVAACQPTIRWA